jgi:hypothetical protein
MTTEDPAVTQPRKRPLGATLICLLLGWLTVAAIFNAVLLPTLAPPGIFPNYIYVLFGAYAITAGATTVGLWRMKPWALTAFRAWGTVCLVLLVCFLVVFRVDLVIAQDPLGQSIMVGVTTGTMALIYWLLHRYVKRCVASGV